MDSARLQPALLGGVFIGVMSALPFVNCCCCLWVLAGGALAVYLRQQNLPGAIEASEGALMGLIAGFIGGIIAVILSIPIDMMMGPVIRDWIMQLMARAEMQREAREMMEQAMARSEGFSVVNAMFLIIASVVFGLIGGLLGVAIFRKSAPPPPPPPPIPHDPGVAH